VPAAYEAAEFCALNTLAYLRAATGTLDSVKPFVLVSRPRGTCVSTPQ
jgi:hypothetical protein